MNLAVLKKYLVLEITGAIVAAVVIFSGIKLYSASSLYMQVKSELDGAMARLEQLYGRVPSFPSKPNIVREKRNYDELLDAYNELNDALRTGQIDPKAMKDFEFNALLEKTLGPLRERLESARVVIPTDRAFSFGTYAGGKMAHADNIPRLVQQLMIIEKLCLMMPSNGITDLVSITREEFEGKATAAPAPTGRGAAVAAAAKGQPDAKSGALGDNLYVSQHFTFKVQGRESAIASLLNQLASIPLFVVVTSVDMKNMKPPERKDTAAAKEPVSAPAASTNTVPLRDARVVLGMEVVEALIEVDVYEFAPSLGFKAELGKLGVGK